MATFNERYKTDYQYYPTPDEVIAEMLLDEDIVDKKILEPSAGSGNIVRWLKQHGAREVVAFELDEYLRRIVSGECRVLGSDFLKSTKSDAIGCDYIIMNPPFLYANEHINHAFEIAPVGCTIIALCNKSNFERYQKKGSERAIFLENVRKYGSCYDMGKAFERAEHATQCEIDDVTRALCYLTGTDWDSIGRLDTFLCHNPQKWGEWFEWGFFRCKGFLKGTMHFEFKDEKIWQLFNQTAAKGKGWQIGNK